MNNSFVPGDFLYPSKRWIFTWCCGLSSGGFRSLSGLPIRLAARNHHHRKPTAVPEWCSATPSSASLFSPVGDDLVVMAVTPASSSRLLLQLFGVRVRPSAHRALFIQLESNSIDLRAAGRLFSLAA
jgi:hypothetical protein